MNASELERHIFGLTFAALAPAPSDKGGPARVALDVLAEVLDALPSYAEIELTLADASRSWEVKVMARDMPGRGRRFTCLTTGTEWFDIREILALSTVVLARPAGDRFWRIEVVA